MNPLKSFETTLASLVEGAFGRLFRSEVRPMEIARKLAREMDEHRTTSVSRVYAPNEYAVWLSPQDRARYDGVEHELLDELCAYLLEHARSEGLTLASHPLIAFHTDPDLKLGEFGIQARLVRPDGQLEGEGDDVREDAGGEPRRGVEWEDRRREPWRDAAPAPARGDAHGRTMIYGGERQSRGLLLVGSRQLLLAPEGAVIGRSRDCDIVLDDVGISRRHAHIHPTVEGWTIEDLQSTNGVLLNGERLRGARALHVGDRIELGSTELVFEQR
ncbi:MAG TPA: DUF3662 and FHA domain-containing protein [Solirubrobacteraceae bacterium]|nr:DUF3662 and FHA domain-containing protein [Solirubrobacteraceae bacterium]